MHINMKGEKLFMGTIVSFFISFLLCAFGSFTIIENKMKEEMLVMENLVMEKSRRVGEILLRLLYKTQAVSVLALRNYEPEEFKQVAAMIIDDPAILNIIIAPDGVISDVYPLAGNEIMIGMDLFTDWVGDKGAVLAKETRQLVIGGPFNSVYGNQIIVGGQPVFISEPDGTEHFWGMVSVTLKYPEVLDGAGLDEFHSQGFDYEIWRINPDGGEKQVILSSGFTGSKSARYIENQYLIQNAVWNYRVYFRRSWYEYPETWILLLVALCISVLFAATMQKKSKAMSEQTAMLSEAEGRARLMLDTSPLCCQIITANFNTIDCNEAAVKLYGYTNKEEYITKWDTECMPKYQPNGKPTRNFVWENCLKAIKNGNHTYEIMHQMPDGTPLPAEVTVVRVNYKGSVAVIAYTRDLRDIKKLEVKAEKIYYDALTGIYNRRYLDENLERIIKSLSRPGGILCLMMVDIDFFKNYNDTYGHSMGDTCLINIATTLSKTVAREGDFVARYGGEEFVVVLPHADEKGARVVADKLLESVRKLGIPHEKSDAASFVTISIGVTTSSVQYTQKAVDYIKNADKALYMSKQNGRNRYTYFDFENVNT